MSEKYKYTFFSLSVDVRLFIFSFLEAEDLARANKVCKEFGKLAENDNIWRKLFERDKKLWKAFQNELPQSSSNANLKSSHPSVFSQFAKSVLEFLTKSEQKEKKRLKKEEKEEEEVAPNVHWKQLYLQQYLANKPQSPPALIKQSAAFKIIMLGEGKEGKGAAKKLLYEIMWNPSSPVKMAGLYPGTEGLGSGVGFKVNGIDLNLVAINKYEDRKLLEQNRPAVVDYFKSAHGFIYVLDSLDDLKKSKQELNNFINDGWIGKGTAILVWLITGPSLLAKPPTATTSVPSTSSPSTTSEISNSQESQERIPADIAQEMGFNTIKDRNWSFRTVDTQSLEGIGEENDERILTPKKEQKPFKSSMDKIAETLKIDETKKKLKETNKKIQDFFKLDEAVSDDFYLQEPKEAPIKKFLKPIEVNRRKKQTLDEEEHVEEITGIRSITTKKKVTRRIFNRDGTVNVLRYYRFTIECLKVRKKITFLRILYQLRDPFHTLLNANWGKVIAYIWIYYLASWLFFALFYWYCPGECLGVNEGTKTTFIDAFLFSLETQTTIGFGNLYPSNYFAQVALVMQCLIGLILDACLLGVIYAKFANPSNTSTSVLFSRNAVICKRDGIKCLVFRVANMRKYTLMGSVFKVYYVADAQTLEGERYLRFQEMKVNNEELVFFSGFPFTVIHKIDESSPLYKYSTFPEDGEVIVLLEACDTSTSNNSQTRFSYTSAEILEDEYFADIVSRSEDGTLSVDYAKFHTTGPLEDMLALSIKDSKEEIPPTIAELQSLSNKEEEKKEIQSEESETIPLEEINDAEVEELK